MNNIKIRPTWCWKPFDVPELSEIQKEFQHIQQLRFPGLNQNNFQYIDKDTIEHHAPVYCEFLKRIKLYKRRSDTVLISSFGNDNSYPIHIDGEDWENRCFALNIPVYNCDDSYTVWYNGTRSGKPGTYTDPNDQRSAAILYDETTAVEIDRMPASTPAIINVTIPHRPVTLHGKLRYLVSTRFGPEIFDVVRKYNTR